MPYRASLEGLFLVSLGGGPTPRFLDSALSESEGRQDSGDLMVTGLGTGNGDNGILRIRVEWTVDGGYCRHLS
jgi:hypothetical protein